MKELLNDMQNGIRLIELVEILNGILFPALFWMNLFLVMHFRRAWVLTRETHPGARGILPAVKSIYLGYKPEIALFVIICAFCIRTFVLWYLRWIRNNDRAWEGYIVENSSEILITFTGLIIVGAFCWIRVISPYVGRHAAALWCLMISTSMAFGVVMHYAF